MRVRLRAVLRTQPGLRLLGPSDLPAMLELTACDPVVNVFADYRARLTQLDPRWLGGEVWGFHEDGRLVSACHAAANLVPVQATPEALVAFAERAAAQHRRCATIVGPTEAVEPLWRAPRAALVGTPREARWRQPHLQISRSRPIAPDPLRTTDRAGRPRRALPGLRGDVHRGGRRLARDRRRRRPLPGPGRAAGREGLVVRPHRGRPGGLQGGGGGRVAVRLPGPGRLRRPRPARRGPRGGRDGGGRARWPCATSRRWSRSTSTSTTSPPARPTPAPASSRPGTFSTIMF